MWGWGNYVLALCEGLFVILRGSPTEIGNVVAVVQVGRGRRSGLQRNYAQYAYCRLIANPWLLIVEQRFQPLRGFVEIEKLIASCCRIDCEDARGARLRTREAISQSVLNGSQ